MSKPSPEPRIDYKIDHADKRLRILLEGAVTAEQMEDCMHRINADPEFQRDFDAIIDLRTFTPTLSREDLQRLAMFVRQHPGNPGARRAVIVPDEQTLIMTRAFESLTFLSPVIYRSFRTKEAAEAWLAEHHLGKSGSSPSSAPDRQRRSEG